MKRMARTLTLLLMVMLSNIATAQTDFEPKLIKTNKAYKHGGSKVKFPTSIGNFDRAEITQFDKGKENIGSRYIYKSRVGNSILSVYIYPAGDATDRRFRADYESALAAMLKALGEDLKVESGAVQYKKDGYTINGYKAVIEPQQGVISLLQLYECGNWFFKIRISSNKLDSAEVNLVVKDVLKEFNPVDLVKSKPLSANPTITLAPSLAEDTVLMQAVIAAAVRKISWATKNVYPEENAAGFPSLYLHMHLQAIEEFVKSADSSDAQMGDEGKAYVDQYKLLINAGFLEEYVMEQYNRVMIVPRDVVLDYDAYDKWKQSNHITIDDNRLYLVKYNEVGKGGKK